MGITGPKILAFHTFEREIDVTLHLLESLTFCNNGFIPNRFGYLITSNGSISFFISIAQSYLHNHNIPNLQHRSFLHIMGMTISFLVPSDISQHLSFLSFVNYQSY
jgi:hypothetical protein